MWTQFLEYIFDSLDKKLHKETYIELQDRAIDLELDIKELENKIEMYEDNVEHERDCDF